MTWVMRHRTAVLLPGTGSDEVFVRAVFARPLAAVGMRLVTPPPPRGAAVVTEYTRVLDAAAHADGPIVVGGISLGAHLGTAWASRNPERCAGVLAALPAWNGPPTSAPAALAATASADLVAHRGVDEALALSTRGVAPWLADELRRAWRRHGGGLEAALRAAARHPAPELPELRALPAAVGIAACADDPVHPAEVARQWAAALPRSALRTITWGVLGDDRESLGRAAVLAWLRALVTPNPEPPAGPVPV